MWLAFNAPHVPYHEPPNHLHDFDSLPTNPAFIEAHPSPHYQAAAQALDTEIGRLLDSMDADTRTNTMVIFVADNGTPKAVPRAPYSPGHAKATLYQGGVNVPRIVSGQLIGSPGRKTDRLVNTTHLSRPCRTYSVSIRRVFRRAGSMTR